MTEELPVSDLVLSLFQRIRLRLDALDAELQRINKRMDEFEAALWLFEESLGPGVGT